MIQRYMHHKQKSLLKGFFGKTYSFAKLTGAPGHGQIVPPGDVMWTISDKLNYVVSKMRSTRRYVPLEAMVCSLEVM